MTVETTTTDETHELTAELIESGPTLFDYADLIFKAIIAASAVVIAGRLS